jgi:hypothetical protein
MTCSVLPTRDSQPHWQLPRRWPRAVRPAGLTVTLCPGTCSLTEMVTVTSNRSVMAEPTHLGYRSPNSLLGAGAWGSFRWSGRAEVSAGLVAALTGRADAARSAATALRCQRRSTPCTRAGAWSAAATVTAASRTPMAPACSSPPSRLGIGRPGWPCPSARCAWEQGSSVCQESDGGGAFGVAGRCEPQAGGPRRLPVHRLARDQPPAGGGGGSAGQMHRHLQVGAGRAADVKGVDLLLDDAPLSRAVVTDHQVNVRPGRIQQPAVRDRRLTTDDGKGWRSTFSSAAV